MAVVMEANSCVLGLAGPYVLASRELRGSVAYPAIHNDGTAWWVLPLGKEISTMPAMD